MATKKLPTCAQCGTRLSNYRTFCNASCRGLFWRGTNPNRSAKEKYNLSTATVGAVSELIAAAVLSQYGINIFRAVSPSSPCDLIGLKDGKCLRFEVRSARYNKINQLSFPIGKEDRCDYYVLVAPDNRVFVLPAPEPGAVRGGQISPERAKELEIKPEWVAGAFA